MRETVAIAVGKSNLVPATLGGERNEAGRAAAAVNKILREKFGNKTWASVAFLLKIEERTARHRLAGTRHYDFGDAIKLLKAEMVGFDVLKAMMGDKKTWPKWFRICVAQIKMAKDRTVIKQLQLDYAQRESEVTDDAASLAEEA